MASNHWDVGEFHKKFGLDKANLIEDMHPRSVSPEVMDFRIKFMYEELKEFEDAYHAGDEAGMFDALIDLTYVAMGTSHLRGYPWRLGWDAVQTANMAKVRAQADGSDSARGSSFDVVKPPGWIPPDIQGLLEDFGWSPYGGELDA